MARTPTIVDQYGNPIRLSDLKKEQASPDSSPIRTLTDLAASRAMTPTELARLLNAAAHGDLFAQARLCDAMEDKDSHILSEISKRKRAVAGLEWEVLPWDDTSDQMRITDFLYEVLSSLDIEGTIFEMADAIGKGLAAIEMVWDASSSQWIVKDLVARPLEWFQWRQDGIHTMDELRLRDGSLRGERLIPGKWLIHRHPAKSGSPFKASLYRVLAWLFLFRNYSVKAWAQFIETFGVPFFLGKYPVGSPKSDQDILLDALASIASRAAVIIPDGMEIEIKELAYKGASGESLHKALLDWAGREISKAILGQTLTTDTNGKGSYALGEIHNEVRYDILRHDARLISNSIQKALIRPLVELNFGPRPNGDLPYFRLTVRRPEDARAEADVLKTLVEAGFTDIPLWWVREKFNIPAPEDGDATLADLIKGAQTAQNRSRRMKAMVGMGQRGIAKNRGAGSEILGKSRRQFTPEQEEIERFIEALMQEGGSAFHGAEGEILKAILSAASYEEAMTKILELYPEIDAGKLEDALTRGILNAELFGRYAAQKSMEDSE